MTGKKTVVKKTSVSIFGLLGILFIALKLTDQIDWSWLWVLSPFWLPTALVFGFGFIVVVASIIAVLID